MPLSAITIRSLVTHASLSQGCDTDYEVLKPVFLVNCPYSVFHHLDKSETNNLKVHECIHAGHATAANDVKALLEMTTL